jgi:catechol 2,3-dioxygenase-like lactoylglutathione lyase family enzyme
MRLLPNICTDDLGLSRDFYVELLGLEVKYDSDWYVQLCVPGKPELEYGIIRRDHELVPPPWQQAPTGMYMTFVVEDVDSAFQRAQAMGLEIIQAPKNEFYGQRRFLTRDPAGCLIDICSPWE